MKKQHKNPLRFENRVLLVFRERRSANYMNFTTDVFDTTTGGTATIPTTNLPPTTGLTGGREFR